MGQLVSRNRLSLTLEGARVVIEGAEKEAAEIGVPMDVAVVDDNGSLLAFSRMDGAKITSIQIAIDKAFTAAGARRATHEYWEMAQPGKPAFGIFTAHQGRLMVVGGGLPIFVEGQIVGGVGCSSGTPEQDRRCAQAGIDMLLSRLKISK